MTTITHNSTTVRTTARVGDIMTKRQALSLIKRLGAMRSAIVTEFSDGHQVYRSIGGSDNCWILRKF
jgi:hypothetical protein